MTEAKEAVAYPATTVLLLRDGTAGLEVLMITRPAAGTFAGALVFPGGRVDPADGDPAVLARCRPVEGVDTEAMAYRVAGIRESFEEAHVLLARRIGEAHLIAAADLVALEDRLAASLGRPPHFADLLGTGEIELATDLLTRFAHWITPKPRPKRFDTQFFLARTPIDQVVAHDGFEAVDSVWIHPAHAIAEADAERASLVFATRANLTKLGRSGDVAAALAAAAADRIVTVCPELFKAPDGWRIRIPPDAGYIPFEMSAQGMPS